MKTLFRTPLLAALVAFAALTYGTAQSKPAPKDSTAKDKNANSAPSQSNSAQNAQTPAGPEADWSGMYTFLQEGEFVQLDFQPGGKLDGFVSRLGTLDSDHGLVLDQFVKSGSWSGHDVTFTTNTVHGTWFGFKGRVDRGPGKTVNDDGYYIVKGTLTETTEDSNKKSTAHSRELTVKSFPRDAE